MPITVKMPEPMTAPMPSEMSEKGPSVFLSECSGCSDCAISLSMDLVRNSWLGSVVAPDEECKREMVGKLTPCYRMPGGGR